MLTFGCVVQFTIVPSGLENVLSDQFFCRLSQLNTFCVVLCSGKDSLHQKGTE